MEYPSFFDEDKDCESVSSLIHTQPNRDLEITEFDTESNKSDSSDLLLRLKELHSWKLALPKTPKRVALHKSKHPITVVFDLDETLVHAVARRNNQGLIYLYVCFRPFLVPCLEALSKHF